MEELCDMKANFLKKPKDEQKPQDGASTSRDFQDGDDSDVTSDSETLEELLDWRSKKI